MCPQADTRGLRFQDKDPLRGSDRTKGASQKLASPELVPRWICGLRQGRAQETMWTAGVGLREGPVGRVGIWQSLVIYGAGELLGFSVA